MFITTQSSILIVLVSLAVVILRGLILMDNIKSAETVS